MTADQPHIGSLSQPDPHISSLTEDQDPKWVKEIRRFKGVKSQFVLWGNIHDVYPIAASNQVSVGPLELYLTQILTDLGYRHFFKLSPFRFQTLVGGGEELDFPRPKPDETVTLNRAAELAAKIVTLKSPAALVVNHGSRLADLCQPELAKFHYELFRLSIESLAKDGRFNLIFWVMDKENDLPAWYSLDNPRVRVLPIPKPGHDVRRKVLLAIGPVIPEYKTLKAEDPKRHWALVNSFVDLTADLFAAELISIVSLAAREGLPFPRLAEAARGYKLGVTENPWAKLDRAVLQDGESRLAAKVIGQDKAVRLSLDIVKRSVYDLSGSQFSPYGQRPKGVLFFAGPTGVGKTELAKGLTELIFGSPENYIRFDMSEFNQPHSDQRLLGAPPGYAGYDVGGELTNAIKQRPFSLVLFDEIEKAHPKIMDVFLQILDDGRLSSGRGETVYFSDAILVFTSNLGVYRQTPDGGREELVNPTMPYEEVNRRITEAIFDFFRYQLSRPEILNRLGPNVVVFDFLRPKVADGVYRKMLANVLLKLKETHKIDLKISEPSLITLGQLVTKNLNMGGRGVGNALEEFFVNPLARELFRLDIKGGQVDCEISLKGDQCLLTLSQSAT
ncbi:MAG: AAA family ATPase [Deltaproteobacteria bacterium]|jgi:DNA polymerase III delta prime subunit|nr:AAA family ATPase [Deltaproteobacteria bacterium]